MVRSFVVGIFVVLILFLGLSTSAVAAPYGSYWPFVDVRAQQVYPTWRADLGGYLPSGSSYGTRLNANMLTIHALAASTGYNGPSRQDERARQIVDLLTRWPTFVETVDERGIRIAANNQRHAPGFTDVTGPASISNQHVSLDPKVAEALALAFRAKDALGLTPEQAARIQYVISRVARSPFFSPAQMKLSQFNWHADMYNAYYLVTGDANMLKNEYRSLLEAFARRSRDIVSRKQQSRYLTSGNSYRYLPNRPADQEANLTHTTEYANLVYSGLFHHGLARSAGMPRLSRSAERVYRRWSCSLVHGDWTHGGYLNWDSGLANSRWHLLRYWAFAQYGIITAGHVGEFACNGRQRQQSVALFNASLGRFERMASETANALLPATNFGTVSPEQKDTTDPLFIGSRFAANAARAQALGFAQVDAALPGPMFSYDAELRRVNISTPIYYTSFTMPQKTGYGGMSPTRVMRSDNRVAANLGGNGLQSLSVNVSSGGVTRIETSPRTRGGLGSYGLAVFENGRQLPSGSAGTFRQLVVVTRKRTSSFELRSVYTFRATTMYVTHTIRSRQRGVMSLRFPSWGASSLRADEQVVGPQGRRAGTLRKLQVSSESAGYTVRMLSRLPSSAVLVAAGSQGQASNPRPGRTAVLRIPLRKGGAGTVRYELTVR